MGCWSWGSKWWQKIEGNVDLITNFGYDIVPKNLLDDTCIMHKSTHYGLVASNNWIPNEKFDCEPIVVEGECDRVGESVNDGNVYVFMEVNICDRYLFATNSWFKDGALKVNEKFVKNL